MGPLRGSGRRETLLWYARWIVAAGFNAVGLVGMWFQGSDPYMSVTAMLTAACLQTAGLLTWRRWSGNRVGPLVYSAGLAGMAQHLVNLPNAATLALGYVVKPLAGIMVGHALLLYPDGRFHRRAERAFIVVAYVAALGIRVPNLFVSRTHWLSQCEVRGGCITNPFLIHENSPLAYHLDNAAALTIAALGLGLVGMLVYRIRRAGPAVRLAYRPLMPIVVVLMVSFVVNQRTTVTLYRHMEITIAAGYTVNTATVALVAAMTYGLLRGSHLRDAEEARASLALAAIQERRRLERDLHDGAQQRLLGVGMSIDQARQSVDDRSAVALALDEAATELRSTLTELRELARGLRPALLVEQGLAGALPVLAQHTPVPVRFEIDIDARLPDHVEAAAYFVVSEALQNVAKHAKASQALVTVEQRPGHLRIVITDDGIGGADPRDGSGLRGLADRLEALGGTLAVTSPPGHGTTLAAELPMPEIDGPDRTDRG